ncbi:AMP-binding protein [Phenylobacterium sp. J367]|uniref:AMP-binding protein n=1 Tax=Phenylobacterium sp. J367 TaxID=2898435 RepID=UPI00215130C6|nr:AMP-binding protein [Phenylobacterium sp. J367]MCR5877625.1 AMP-binding protein [Phenylobacterium sp. J367]
MGPSLSGLTLRAADAAEPAVDGGPAWLAVDPRPLDWNGPAARPFVRFRDEDLARPVIDLLQAIARRQPDRIAVTATDGALTFAELWARLSGVAQAVAARTQPDDLVGLLLPASTAFPVAALACLAAGRPFVALDPHYPEQWLSDVQTEARPAMLLRPDEVRDLARAPVSDAWRPTPAGPDEPACVLFTSGSTGKPKGIVNSQRNLLQRVAQSVNAAHLNADDRFLTLASLCTIVGIRDLLTALLAGGSVRLVDPGRLDAREIVDLVRADGITVLFAFPALLRSVLEAGPGAAGETLRLVRVGGDTTLWSDIDLIRGWLPPGAAIQSIYAATEAPMMQWFAGDAARADDLRIPIGYPLPGNRLAIVDGRGRAVRPGEVGELIVASPYVAVGRWTGGRFVADPAGDGRTFRTGDLVRQRPDGLIERIGRQDRQVKIRGARVELDGVEALIRQHPGVRDVGVLVRVRRPGAAATLVACVHAQDSAPAGLLQDLRARMASAPPAMRPGRYHLVDEVPRLPSSKLDTRALAALDAARAPAAAAPRPNPAAGGDPIARTVAEVWRSVLGAPVRGPDDDFFEAGGDSSWPSPSCSSSNGRWASRCRSASSARPPASASSARRCARRAGRPRPRS